MFECRVSRAWVAEWEIFFLSVASERRKELSLSERLALTTMNAVFPCSKCPLFPPSEFFNDPTAVIIVDEEGKEKWRVLDLFFPL